MKRHSLAFVLALLWVLGACGTKQNQQENLVNMTRPQFDALLDSDKLVLVDFYADWCGPCKKMTPYLEEIKTEMSDKVTLVRINTDDNPELAQQLSIEGLPTLLLFKNKSLVWQNVGYIPKEEVVKQLN